MFNRKSGKRISLEAFKAHAGDVSVKQSIDKITGGTLANCHGGKIAVA